MANGNFGGGTGILTNPYLVEDSDDLSAIGSIGEHGGKHFKIMRDLTASESFEGIISPSSRPIYIIGNEKTISGLQRPLCKGLDSPGEVYIYDLKIKNAHVTPFTARDNGIIRGDYGTVYCENVQIIDSKIIKTYTSQGFSIAGFGGNYTSVYKGCDVINTIVENYNGNAVGFCFNTNGIKNQIQRCSVQGGKVISHYSNVGNKFASGFVGYSAGASNGNYTIRDCYSNTEVYASASDIEVNGFIDNVDLNSGHAINCYSSSICYSSGNSIYLFGCRGFNSLPSNGNPVFENCYSIAPYAVNNSTTPIYVYPFRGIYIDISKALKNCYHRDDFYVLGA